MELKKILAVTLFMLAAFAWAAAQQPMTQEPSAPSQSPTQSGRQTAPQDQTQPDQTTSATVTEGCLGGSNPNFTLTDKAGTTYKLNIPANADTSKLAAHVGESVAVAGNVNGTGNSSTIDVRGIGRGTGTCPGSKSSPPPPKH